MGGDPNVGNLRVCDLVTVSGSWDLGHLHCLVPHYILKHIASICLILMQVKIL